MSTTQPLKYLDKAMNGLRDLNLVPEKTDEAPIIVLLHEGLGSLGLWRTFPEQLAARTDEISEEKSSV